MNKRAQIFTLVFILLISFMFVTFEIYSFIAEKDSIKARIDTMNGFLDTIEKNLEKQLYVSGYRIIFLASTQITESGSYISDFDTFFEEAFIDGTVNGEPNDAYLTGATYDDLVSFIDGKASKVNLDVSFSNPEVMVYQDNPWYVTVQMESDFIMRDESNLANWTKRQVIVAHIPINGFEDPVYTINTNAKITRKIYPTIYEGHYASSSDVSNLSSHVQSGYYAASTTAPSYLNRLEGDLSANDFGIESFVSATELSNQGITVKDKTLVDYIYFSTNDPTDYSVSGMQSWFKIDDSDGHLSKYNVSSLIY